MGMRIAKYVALLSFLALILILLFKSHWFFGKPHKLNGYFVNVEEPVLSDTAWFSGSFQQNFDTHFKENLRVRPNAVRAFNQMDYWLFDMVHAKDAYITEDEWCFRESGDFAVRGIDFIGQEKADERCEKLQYISECLAKQGTEVTVVIAPSKPWYHFEHIPEDHHPGQRPWTNYSYFAEKGFPEHDITCVDLNAWFLQLKDTTSWPLYTMGGVHWTLYGSYLGIDSVFGHIEHLDSIDMPGIYWDEMKLVNTWDPERDLVQALNLALPTKEIDIYHPVIQREDSVGRTRPDVMVIGDSYYHYSLWHGMQTQAFSPRSSFWYYWKQKESNESKLLGKRSDFDLATELRDLDHIILFFNATNMSRFSYGFIEEVYAHLKEHNGELEAK